MLKLLKTLTFIVLLTQTHNGTVRAREYDECADVTEPDTVVASKLSCAKYIFCDGRDSFEGECLGGNYFNEPESICDDPANVKCDIVESEGVLSIYDENFNKSNGKDDTSSAVNKEEDLPVNVESNNTIINLPNARPCFDIDGMTNKRRLEHSESCSAFYICHNGLAIPMLCPRNLYFNAETQKCQQQMPRTCKLRYSVRLNCRKGVYDYMPHPQRCEYYHYCLNGFLMIMRCPNDFTWHFERRTCVHKSQSKCYMESSILAQQPVIAYRDSSSSHSNSRTSNNSDSSSSSISRRIISSIVMSYK